MPSLCSSLLHKRHASPQLTLQSSAFLFQFSSLIMNVEQSSRKPVEPVKTKEDIFVMSTEKASQTSSPLATHAEHLAAESQHPDYRPTSVPGQPAYGEHGVLVDHKVPQEDVVQSEPDLRWSRIRHYLREPFSEFFGVFILIMFGDGVVAQVVLSNGERGDCTLPPSHHTYVEIGCSLCVTHLLHIALCSTLNGAGCSFLPQS